MSQFVQEYEASKFNMSSMRAGVSVREIKHNKNGLRIFKLRINKGDRLLFTFDTMRIRPEYRQSIIFLDYCHHDDQAMQGRTIGLHSQDVLEYEPIEERIELEIDQRYADFDYDPNRVITRVMDVQTMAQLLDDREDRAVYYLNDEQFACLKEQDAPTFIFGSAGSGKTTINIHKAFILATQPINIGYFTYSNYLVEDAKKLFHKIIEQSPEYRADDLIRRVNFHPLNEYMSATINQYNVVTYEQFRTWIIERQPLLLRQLDLPIYDIWKEIRGLIKGMIPKEWLTYRVNIHQKKIPMDLVDVLIQKGLAKRSGDDFQLQAEKLYAAKARFLDAYETRAILLMHELLDEYLLTHPMIDENIYYALDEQYCVYSRQSREWLYELTLRYQAFLQETGLLDENDLAREFLKKVSQKEMALFDFVIADEIQDLTEIQIYCLIRLAKNKNQLLFSGDINQTIRPTYFHTGRIESLLKTSNTHLGFIKHQLIKNYRSTKEVVDLANQVVDLRVEHLGRQKKHDYHEVAVREAKHSIYYFNSAQPKEVMRLLETAIQRHYVAIVVPNEAEKRNFQQLTQLKGAIFTVEEIKGIEKDYIICYNVMSYYHKEWERILTTDVKYQNQYRYYFNLLYVALTRARHHLCFIEEKVPSLLYEYFRPHFLMFEAFDEAELKLNQISTDNEFYKEAKRYEAHELYEQAILEYERSNLAGADQDVKRCRALMLNKEGHHLEAGHALMQLKAYDLAAKCYRQAQNQLLYLKARVFSDVPFQTLKAEFEQEGIDLVSFVYDREEPISWVKRFNRLYMKYVFEQMKGINRMIDTIEKMKG